jgi:phosphatidylinositol 3,4,5-trisphosphate-dependent Rac exchanger 2 protein
MVSKSDSSIIVLFLLPCHFLKALHSLVVSNPENDQEKARGLQLSVNVEAVSALKQYYRKFRSFHLDKNKMPDTSAAKVALLDKILKPLNALEELMRAVETSMKIHQENVGFLNLCTELGSRMGATLVISCLRGTDATAMALTLEQVVLLTRCHGLPPKSFQTALSVMRSQGVRIHNNKKNTNIPKFAFTGALPPRLYVPPPSVSQAANQTH